MMTDSERYSKNVGAFSREEIEAIRLKSVCVVGCGGLGGHVAMALARFGVGSLSLVDGDVFVSSNLNRQLFCMEANIGKSKVLETQEALLSVNSGIEIIAYPEMLDHGNHLDILSGHDLVMECLDNIPARFLLENGCRITGVPFVHGAVGGFYGQVCCVFPGDDILQKLYTGAGRRETPPVGPMGPIDVMNHKDTMSPIDAMGAPSFIPQLVAAIQCSEALKLLAGRADILRNKLLFADLSQNSFKIIDLSL